MDNLTAVRRIPPLSALRPFEAAARHLSFTAAAHELHITQAAVSRQIAQLEAFFEQPLFTRANRSVQLTSRGRRLHHAVAEALDVLARSAEEMRDEITSTDLRIATDLPFAHLWLMPQLPRFVAAYPDVNPCITA